MLPPPRYPVISPNSPSPIALATVLALPRSLWKSFSWRLSDANARDLL